MRSQRWPRFSKQFACSLRRPRSERGQSVFFFFFQAEDGIRDLTVTGVQTCALPISRTCSTSAPTASHTLATALIKEIFIARKALEACLISSALLALVGIKRARNSQIGRASCRERV